MIPGIEPNDSRYYWKCSLPPKHSMYNGRESSLFVVSRHMIRRENVTCVKYNGLIG